MAAVPIALPQKPQQLVIPLCLWCFLTHCPFAGVQGALVSMSVSRPFKRTPSFLAATSSPGGNTCWFSQQLLWRFLSQNWSPELGSPSVGLEPFIPQEDLCSHTPPSSQLPRIGVGLVCFESLNYLAASFFTSLVIGFSLSQSSDAASG